MLGSRANRSRMATTSARRRRGLPSMRVCTMSWDVVVGIVGELEESIPELGNVALHMARTKVPNRDPPHPQGTARPTRQSPVLIGVLSRRSERWPRGLHGERVPGSSRPEFLSHPGATVPRMATRVSPGGRADGRTARGPAACYGLFHLFFSDEQDDVDVAKRICRGCDRRASCLRAALDRREACGVWGGELLRDGAILAEVPRRGRPPSTAA